MAKRVFPENMSSIRPEIDFLKSNKVWEKILNALYHPCGSIPFHTKMIAFKKRGVQGPSFLLWPDFSHVL